ncbi:MAG: winged helix-turn-helix domain-containing protein [Sphingomicrobium sp.]
MNGERRELEPKVAQVLVALALARSNVVSRDRLIEQCWDGRIVGDDALNRCIVALRHLAKDFSPEPFAIETVPRVGYSLVERPEIAAARSAGKTRKKVAIGALLILLVIATALVLSWPRLARVEAAPASIAVMSFRNLSAGDPYFAEGIGEEILGQLSREPQFRVAGRASSNEFGKDPDVRDVARQLDVDYVVEGSVRRQGDQVRVNANLVRASDGIRLWSDSYDGKLDDIFAIQQRIGGAIAAALRRKLVRTPALSGPLVTNGDAYNLYLTARGLIRMRDRKVAATASNLLREAINLDPGYAPAWAGLAEATYLEPRPEPYEGFIEKISQGQGYARHALRLAPDLAEAHRTLGMLLGYGSPEAQAHFRRAAELDPNSSENLVALGSMLGAKGEFDQELAAYKRAGEFDPLWFHTVGALAIALAEMGDRAEAEAVARRGFAKNIDNQHILLGRLAWILGDYSEALRHWAIVVRGNSLRWNYAAQRNLNDGLFTLGLSSKAVPDSPTLSDQPRRVRVWMEAAPSAAVWRAGNRNPIAIEVYRYKNHVAAKLMLGSGRTRALAVAYDGSMGLLRLRPRQPLRVDQLPEAPIVAIALRQAGRAPEAYRLLREAEVLTRSVYRRNRVPFWFDADAAALWATQGRKDEALTALERAFSRGWTHTASTDLPDINDEPAFRSLHGQPRFERLRAKLAVHHARERAETVQLRI